MIDDLAIGMNRLTIKELERVVCRLVSVFRRRGRGGSIDLGRLRVELDEARRLLAELERGGGK